MHYYGWWEQKYYYLLHFRSLQSIYISIHQSGRLNIKKVKEEAIRKYYFATSKKALLKDAINK